MHIYKVISLFCGCGGLDLGIRGDFSFLGKYYPKNSFKTILANDIDKRAILTFKHNFLDVDADVLLGGFPCQDFSLAGKQQGLNADRGKLYLSMIKALKKNQT